MKKHLIPALLAGMLSTAAFAGPDYRDVVHDTNRHIILNTFDNCVRTRWQASSDECFAQAAPVVAAKTDRQFLSVYFAFDKDELTPAAQAKLDTVADILRDSQEVESINIVGYADEIGTNDYNRALSKRRADAVRSYLASKGYLKTNKVELRALGESAPVSNCGDLGRNEKIACLWRDRRVEIELNTRH